MLEKITVALITHKDTVTKAKAIFDKATDEIKANYIGAKFAELTGEAKKAYDEAVFESKKVAFDTCNSVLDDVASKAKALVAVPAPVEFNATLEALKAVADLTTTEFENAIGAYKNNYLAYRAICEFKGGAVKGFKPVTLDDILQAVNGVREVCLNTLNSGVESYKYTLAIDPTNTYFAGWDAVFTAFYEARFEDATTAYKEKTADEANGELVGVQTH